MFLDSEPEEIFQLPRSGMPLKEKKKNGYTIVSDGENLHVLEFFAAGNKGKAVRFFILSRVAYVAQFLNSVHL